MKFRGNMLKAVAVAGVLGFAAFSSAADAGEINIAVAANFTDATRDIVAAFEKETGNTVKASFGSTGKLYTQIANGAPFQIFLAADSVRPPRAVKEGYGVDGSVFTYAIGKVVLWSPTDDLFSDGEAYLKEGKFDHIALANPKTAPYGLAGQQTMEHIGVWKDIKSKVVQGDSISQTFQFAASGNAEVGFVALSEVKAWKDSKGSQWVVPQEDYTPIQQQAVVLKSGADNDTAKAFISFLKGPEAQKIIEGYGYAVADD